MIDNTNQINIAQDYHKTSFENSHRQSLLPTSGMVNRFNELAFNMRSGLEAGETILRKLPEGRSQEIPKSLQDRLIHDVSSLEKGLEQVMNLNDLNAKKHLESLKSEDGVANEAQILFEYSNFSAQYFVATNYINGSGQRTSEELQIFTRSR